MGLWVKRIDPVYAFIICIKYTQFIYFCIEIIENNKCFEKKKLARSFLTRGFSIIDNSVQLPMI